MRWSEALNECGFAPNQLQGKFPDDEVLATLARIVRKSGHVPVRNELRMLRREDNAIPNEKVFERIAPTKSQLIAALMSYCEKRGDLDDVIEICRNHHSKPTRIRSPLSVPSTLGEVYLIRSGRYYKIGYSVSAERRTREFQIQLPDPPKRVHTIRTDDPRGVEAYWHKRFEAKRVRPDAEFFRLDANDVRAFCAWKRIAP